MADQKLKEALGRLKKAVDAMDPKDAESRDMLTDLAASIEAKLNQRPSTGKKGDLQETLREQAAVFKLQHPLVGNLLDEIADVLTHLGV